MQPCWLFKTACGECIGCQVSAGARCLLHPKPASADKKCRSVPPPPQALPTVIGSRVTIGPGATVHAATIEDCVVIGMGATIMDGAKVRLCLLLCDGSCKRVHSQPSNGST